MLCCDVNIGKRLTPQRRSSLVLTSVDFWCFSFAQFNETLNVVVFPVTLLNSEPASTMTAIVNIPNTSTNAQPNVIYKPLTSSGIVVRWNHCLVLWHFSLNTRCKLYFSFISRLLRAERLLSRYSAPFSCVLKRPWERNLAESQPHPCSYRQQNLGWQRRTHVLVEGIFRLL